MVCVHRYLKNVFPKADETILLEILEQSDNNVQKASERLIDLGYEKRNPTLPAKALAKKKEEEQVIKGLTHVTRYLAHEKEKEKNFIFIGSTRTSCTYTSAENEKCGGEE